MREREMPPSIERPSPTPQDHGGVERVRTSEERAELQARDAEQRERGIAEAHEQLEVLGPVLVEETTPPPTHTSHDQQRIAPARVGDVLANIGKRIGYPSSDRLVRVAKGTVVAAGGAVGALAVGAPMVGLAGLGGALVGGVAFFSGEVLKRLHRREVGSVMSVTKVYDRLTSADHMSTLGELHLVGKKGLEAVRAAAPEQKRAVFLAEVERSLAALEQSIRNNDPAVADLAGFFGETDVFSKRDLDGMGLPYTESPISPARKPLLWVADKVTKIISGRWKSIGASRRSKPVYRIAFTREQFLGAMRQRRGATNTPDRVV